MLGPDQVARTCTWERRAPAEPATIGALRRGLVTYARSIGASEQTCEAIALAAGEALTNVVRRAYVGQEPEPIIVEARLDNGGRVLVRVADEGVGPQPQADSPGLGLGLGLMAQMADDFAIAHRHELRGTIVSLRFSLGARDPEGDTATAPRTDASTARSR